MYTINAELREEKANPRQLRKQGITPCCIFGGDFNESLLIQIPDSEVNRMLREKSLGGMVKVICDGNEYPSLIKDLDQNILNNKPVHVGFQNIKKGEVVNSVANVIYINNNDTDFLVHQLLEEIPYKAKAENLVEEIVIDLDGNKEEKTYLVKDLAIANDDDIDIQIDEDLVVLNIVNNTGYDIDLEEGEEDEDLDPSAVMTVAESESEDN